MKNVLKTLGITVGCITAGVIGIGIIGCVTKLILDNSKQYFPDEDIDLDIYENVEA